MGESKIEKEEKGHRAANHVALHFTIHCDL